MGKQKKEPKKRAEKYEEKLAIKGAFEDVIAAAFKSSKKETTKEK